MSLLQWKIETKEGSVLKDEVSLYKGGAVRVITKVPEGETFKRVSAKIRIPLSEEGRIFMNGYQGHTYVPERTPKDAIRGLMLMHQAIVTKNSLDRYGDYHFVDYPNKRGITHGFSYCYFREGEKFQLVASLDERPGYTMFTYDATQNRLEIVRDCKGMNCKNGEDGFHAFDLFFADGPEDEVFDAWFAELGIKPHTDKLLAGYASWHSHQQDINAEKLLADLEGAGAVLEAGDLFRIDDGWQQYVGDWKENEKAFPSGMKYMAERIHGKGYKAGLWMAPFVAEKSSALYKEHSDWLFQRKDKNWKCGNNWSGFYALDIDNRDVRNYIKESVNRVLNEWGYDAVMLDYLYAAAPYGTKDESRAARMIRAMEFLRDLCGDKIMMVSNVPLMPAFGLADYCRTGPDVTLDWDDKALVRLAQRERPSTRHAIGNAIYHRQLDRRAFMSDPDVFFLRKDNIKLSDPQKVQLYEACVEYGSVLMISDNAGAYSETQIAQYKSIREAWAG